MDDIYALKNLLTPAQVAEVHELLGNAQFTEGSATASGAAARVKNNQQVVLDQVAGLREFFTRHVSSSRLISGLVMPRAFSGMIVSRYLEGMGYGSHVDSAFLNSGRRSDVSFTLFLSSLSEYDGGELVLETAVGEHPVRLEAGSMILYPTGYLHRVNTVTRGQRLVIVGWIESRIRDARQRKVILDLVEARRAYQQQVGDDAVTAKMNETIEYLRRLWDG